MNDIERRLLDRIAGAPWSAALPEAVFNSLACDAFRFQAASIQPLHAYARHLGASPDSIRDWRRIPPVPASAFKTHDLSAASREVTGAPGAPGVLFETSGTSISKPGRVRLTRTALYEASLLRSFERHLLPDGARLRAVVFGPARREAPRSSLWFMVDRAVERLAAGGTWIVREEEPRWELADRELERAGRDAEPVLLLGTTLLFLAYFERLAARGARFALPPGSRAMDTGGAKGRQLQLTRADVVAGFARFLGIPATHLVNEYGMAEMGSQFYGDNLLAATEGREAEPGQRIPPWVRTRALDPETLEELPAGRTGILVHYDLANLEIPLAVQTEDVGALARGDRLILEGRLPGAEARGCSLAFERFMK